MIRSWFAGRVSRCVPQLPTQSRCTAQLLAGDCSLRPAGSQNWFRLCLPSVPTQLRCTADWSPERLMGVRLVRAVRIAATAVAQPILTSSASSSPYSLHGFPVVPYSLCPLFATTYSTETGAGAYPDSLNPASTSRRSLGVADAGCAGQLWESVLFALVMLGKFRA